VGWPTFLVIGAAKAGTSSLHEYLSEHPDVFLPERKEPNFFAFDGRSPSFSGPGDDDGINRHSVVDVDQYTALFDGAGDVRASGEASPLYLYDERAPHRIAARLPEARLIVLLRDPVSRGYASWLHKRRDGVEPCRDFVEGLAREPERIAAGWEFIWHYRRAGRYAAQLERYFDVFPAKQIQIHLTDDLESDPIGVMRSIFEFIGVDPSFEPDVSQRYNPSGVPKSRALHQLLVGAQLPRRVARRLLSRDRRDRIFRALVRRNLSKPSLPPEVRARLADQEEPEIGRLEALIDRDLTSWRR
jgi:hypothetical protein